MAKHQIVKAKRKLTLKQQLDKIDTETFEKAYDGFYESRLAIELNMWEKGEAVGQYRGGKLTYYRLEKETSRHHDSLKKWHQLYLKYPSREKYLPFAESKAKQWTDRAFAPKTQTSATALPLPKGKYRTIVVDPPWPIQRMTRPIKKAQERHYAYQTMPVEEIFKLKLPAHKESCNVFLWTTHKFLPAAFECFNKWDVRYICTFVWHKPGGFQPYKQPQRNCEFVLFGVIGKLKFDSTKKFMCCFNAKRGKHSEKPREFYETIERVSLPPRLDMFARKAHKGFKVWGLEV